MNQPLDAISHTGEVRADFGQLDMSYRTRMRAFVAICMPPIFVSLNTHLNMMSLRKHGYASIMFYLDFAAAATPIAFGRSLKSEHSIKLYRSISDANNQPARTGTERLLLVSHSNLKAKARSHGPEALGFDDGTGATIEAGTADIMHVITKPVAAAGERQVTTAPEELRVLTEHRWENPLPSVEGLSQSPKGYIRVDGGNWQEHADVWGIPNTDINQHVNVMEYVMGGENQFTRLLHGAGLAVTQHRIARARLLFRKPFFPGQAYVIRSQLYRREQLTHMQAGFHLVEGERPSDRPSAFVVFDGALES